MWIAKGVRFSILDILDFWKYITVMMPRINSKCYKPTDQEYKLFREFPPWSCLSRVTRVRNLWKFVSSIALCPNFIELNPWVGLKDKTLTRSRAVGDFYFISIGQDSVVFLFWQQWIFDGRVPGSRLFTAQVTEAHEWESLRNQEPPGDFGDRYLGVKNSNKNTSVFLTLSPR